MALATYSDLVTAIQEWLAEDTLLANRAPDFIAFCESEMNYGRAAAPGREPIEGFRTLEMQKTELVTLIDGQTDYALPDDYLELQYMTETTNIYLPALTQQTATQMVAETEINELRYYAYIGGGYRLKATPGADQELELGYYGRIPALSDSVPTNWVIDKHPDVYLYGSLIHASPYLLQDSRTSVWAGLYEQAREGVIRSDNAAQRGPVGETSMAYPVI